MRIDIRETIPMAPDRSVAALVEGGWRHRLGAVDEHGLTQLRIGPGTVAGRVLEHEVVARFGAARQEDEGATLDVGWVATGRAAAFPTFTGELSVAPADGGGTELRLHGHYDPPLGVLGALADELLLHGIAEETLVRFVEHLGVALREASR